MINEPQISRRESELLEKLESIQRCGEEITITEFCKREGYANKSALRHFPVLKRELDLYVGRFRKNGDKSSPSAVRFLEIQNERLNRRCEDQEKDLAKIPELEAKVKGLEGTVKDIRRVEGELRGMISTLIAHFSSNDLSRAKEISAKLEELAKVAVAGESLRNENEDQ